MYGGAVRRLMQTEDLLWRISEDAGVGDGAKSGICEEDSRNGYWVVWERIGMEEMVEE